MKTIAIAIIEHDGKLLMVRRREREGNLHWQFPGGAVEEGEAESEAVTREAFEEVNIVCRSVQKFGERVHPTTGRVICYWRCVYEAGELKVKDTDELDMASWMTPLEVLAAITSDLFPPVRRYVEALGGLTKDSE